MWYYKNYCPDGKYILEERNHPCLGENLEEITEEEYIAALQEMKLQWESYICESEDEIDKDERIAELEAENAALLYELLTGEAFAE